MHTRSKVWGLALLVMTGSSVYAEPTVEQKRDARRTPVVEVVEQSRDAVVNISSTEVVTMRGPSGIDELFRDFFDMPPIRPRQFERQSVGSGFILHENGYIVTNAHVVAGTTERTVTFADGNEYDAEIVAVDRQRDLAVLHIDAAQSLPTLPLGRSNDLMIGETVVAIGNALGYQHTVTAGVVSATNRELSISNRMTLKGLIQTDASINPGNSGGPLLNIFGELIGVNTAIRGDAENIGFAIEVDQLREALPELLDIERRYRIHVGLELDALREPRITSIEEGSPAQRAGLRRGDVIHTINDMIVDEPVDYHIALIGRQPGETLRIKYERNGESRTKTLTIERRPAPDGAELALARLGLEVEPLPADLARRLNLRPDTGLIIRGVEIRGPAHRLGVREGDVLIGIGRHHISNMDELGRLLENLRAGDSVQMTVLRIGRRSKMQLYGTIRVR